MVWRGARLAVCLFGSGLFLVSCTDNRTPIQSTAAERLQPVVSVPGEVATSGAIYVPVYSSLFLGVVNRAQTVELAATVSVRNVSTLHHAWSPFAERMIRVHATEDAYASYVDEARNRAAADLRKLTQSLGSPFGRVPMIQRRGRPEDVILEFVASEGIDILVMGTVARGGIPGLLIGNTAERVLRRLRCSVLTLKPDNFVSPVRVDTD